MLCAVIGTQNVGKSTFVRDFLKELEVFSSPTIDYRGIVLSRGLKLNREGNAYSQNVLFNFILKDTLNYAAQSINTILDRSIIDAHVYTIWLYRNRKENSGVTVQDIENQFSVIVENIGKYDRIFYIPLDKCDDIEIEDDKFRDTDPQYRKEVDEIFKEVINKLNLNVVKIFGTREERIDKVLNIPEFESML